MRARAIWVIAATTLTVAAVHPSPPAHADPSADFAAANAAFASGEYAEAAARFRELRDAGVLSANLLYDLGNAESRAGNTGAAVRAYLQALSLRPRDPDTRANLRQTRVAANLETPETGFLDALAASGSIDEWAWLGLLLLAASAATLGRWALRREEDKKLSRAQATLLFVLLAGASASAILARTRWAALDHSVVLGPSPALRVAPFEEATASVELRPGQLVDVERTHEDFALVRTRDGSAGWIATSQVPPILY